MGKIVSEFKQFIMRGNVIDMAVGVIIGGAFNSIVSSLVNDVVMPVVTLITGKINFTDDKIYRTHFITLPPVTLDLPFA